MWGYSIEHLRFFTRATIIELFERNGYRVRSIDGINLTTRRTAFP
jgi:hypothetical protein